MKAEYQQLPKAQMIWRSDLEVEVEVETGGMRC